MKYDLVVVGAGIAGLYLGRRMAREGWRVCVLDRREKIGTPVRCGEATGNRAELSRFVPIDESWIARDYGGVFMHCDGGLEIAREIPDAGLILHRDRFEQSLADDGRECGMEIRLQTAVTGLVWDQTHCRGVVIENGQNIESDYVVAADGAEGGVGRWAGITQTLAPREAFSAIQYTIHADSFDDGYLHFFVGRETIPRGY
ncbi:MAG: NAD(P)-binding protein, partial [Chitinivibrionales bacterium]|nr:NAD(P)-binding protein [Chitinivibrionales bacterium]MBD3357207.1 NAD(P)-binding protein [Chitinivibrionales bacterium]